MAHFSGLVVILISFLLTVTPQLGYAAFHIPSAEISNIKASGTIEPRFWFTQKKKIIALPEKASLKEIQYQPVLDFSQDACYNSVAIDNDGSISSGIRGWLIHWSKSKDVSCRGLEYLENSNTYVKTLCRSSWCVYAYAYFFEMNPGHKFFFLPDFLPHQYDWQTALVFTYKNKPVFTSITATGDMKTRKVSNVDMVNGTHLKLIYEKEPAEKFPTLKGHGRGALRYPDGNDKEILNESHSWYRSKLIGHDAGYPSEKVREKLYDYEWGAKRMRCGDYWFESAIKRARPSWTVENCPVANLSSKQCKKMRDDWEMWVSGLLLDFGISRERMLFKNHKSDYWEIQEINKNLLDKERERRRKQQELNPTEERVAIEKDERGSKQEDKVYQEWQTRREAWHVKLENGKKEWLKKVAKWKSEQEARRPLEPNVDELDEKKVDGHDGSWQEIHWECQAFPCLQPGHDGQYPMDYVAASPDNEKQDLLWV